MLVIIIMSFILYVKERGGRDQKTESNRADTREIAYIRPETGAVLVKRNCSLFGKCNNIILKLL